MSDAVPLINCPLESGFYPINSGVSSESTTVRIRLRKVRRRNWQSYTMGLRLADLIDNLIEVYKECSEENWDGYGAKPITRKVYHEALHLIALLPPSLPLPNIVPEPDGSIGFEWYKEKRNIFVISIGGNNIINFAGLFGDVNKIHGTEFYADSLPQIVNESLQRLFM